MAHCDRRQKAHLGLVASIAFGYTRWNWNMYCGFANGRRCAIVTSVAGAGTNSVCGSVHIRNAQPIGGGFVAGLAKCDASVGCGVWFRR